MLERQESGSVINKLTESDVLRRIADHIDAGGSRPNSLGFRHNGVHILCRDTASWTEWVSVFGGDPADAVAEQGQVEPDLTFVTWSNASVEIEDIRRPNGVQS